MPKKTDHRKASVELAKLSPDTLQAITVRLPAGLLMRVHQWAEQKGLDLASAIRELTMLGRETATRPGGQVSTPAREAVKAMGKLVEKSLRDGKSPLEPFLALDNPAAGLEALPTILAGLDYEPIFRKIRKKHENKSPWIERVWKEMKTESPSHLQPLMDVLDKLERDFLARKQLFRKEGPDGDIPIIHWLLSDDVMERLKDSSSNDPDAEKVRKLIAVRYLVAEVPARPWEFVWVE